MTKMFGWVGLATVLGAISGCAGFTTGGYYPGGYGFDGPGYGDEGFVDAPGIYGPSFGYMDSFGGGFGGGFMGDDDDD